MLANVICDSKYNLPEVQAANKTCTVPAMETVGKRIERLRKGMGWSRPALGRVMAERIGRDKPFTGELIRQYELDRTDPPKDAREGLALAFGRPEAYILYGDTKPTKGTMSDADIFYRKYLALDITPRQIVDLAFGIPSEDIVQKKFRVVRKRKRAM